MKLFVISDIHGSVYYLKKALNKFNESKSDLLVILGDILYHGPRNPLPDEYNPKEVVKLLDEYKNKILAIKGNCDAYVDEMVLPFPLVSESIIYNNNKRIFLTHGHILNKDNMPKLLSGDIMLYGHFHIPFIIEQDGVIIANPSSISLPKEGNKPTYMIIDKDIKIIDFDDSIILERKL